MKEAIPKVTCAIDDSYVVPYLVSIFSGLSNSKLDRSEYEFSLAYTSADLSLNNIEFLKATFLHFGVELKLICLDDFEEIANVGNYPGLVFARLNLADSLRDNFVWIDADTLLLPGWERILDFDTFQDRPFAISGAVDTWIQKNRKQLASNPVVQASFEFEKPYINAGVLKIRPDIWRNSYSDTWKQLAHKSTELLFSMADQDVLNHILDGDADLLNPNLNRIIEPKTSWAVKQGIWHFAGSWKPWSRLTHLRFIGPRASRLWEFYASKVGEILCANQPSLASEYFDKWEALQSKDYQVHGAGSAKRQLIHLLDFLVSDPAFKARRASAL